jgi:lysophospholipid acyltransferase (LPLAT)-like uncharacterized protein
VLVNAYQKRIQIHTEVMELKINTIVSSRFAQWLIYKFIRIYSLTFRFEVQNEDEWLTEYLYNNGRIILCTHHQQFFPAIRYFQKYKKYKPGIMISRSGDGGIISAVAIRTGWITVRGSSSSGGAKGLKNMIDHLAEYRIGGHIIDGPRGPFGVVKPGVIRMAHATGSVIVPFYTRADRAWYFRSWDKFFLPKPFSKVLLRFGDKIEFKQTDTNEQFEEHRKVLEEIMSAGNEQLKIDFE